MLTGAGQRPDEKDACPLLAGGRATLGGAAATATAATAATALGRALGGHARLLSALLLRAALLRRAPLAGRLHAATLGLRGLAALVARTARPLCRLLTSLGGSGLALGRLVMTATA